MVKYVKWAPVLFLAFVALAFVPNVLTDRRDKQDVKDATATTVKTGASLLGRLWGFLSSEWLANHTPTTLPEDRVVDASSTVIVIKSSGNGKVAVVNED